MVNEMSDKIICTCPDCNCKTTFECMHSNDNRGCGCLTCVNMTEDIVWHHIDKYTMVL